MTEEQDNEIATKLTIALIEASVLPFERQSMHEPNETAQGIVPRFLAIRDALMKTSPEPGQP
jgi:hypothetical protein